MRPGLWVDAYRKCAAEWPHSTSFLVTFAKGSASDAIAQKSFADNNFDVQRNVSFALFSGAYLGVGQHYVYNVAFARLFGSGRDWRTVFTKVFADSAVHVPFIYLPLYYPFETIAAGKGSGLDGLRKYREDAPRVLTTYWSTWPLIHVFSFKVLPDELRITFYATGSFLWLIYLSYASHHDGHSNIAPPSSKDTTKESPR